MEHLEIEMLLKKIYLKKYYLNLKNQIKDDYQQIIIIFSSSSEKNTHKN